MTKQVYFDQLREKNDQRHKNDPKPREGSATSKMLASASTPPPKQMYLKKGDEDRMERIKTSIGEREELEVLRNKYKNKNIILETAGRVPLHNRAVSPMVHRIKNDRERAAEERKELFRPIDYTELKVHQHKIDKIGIERKNQASVMISSSHDADFQLSEQSKMLRASNEQYQKDESKKKLQEEKKENLKKLNENIENLPKTLPSKLLKFKNEQNIWKNEHEKKVKMLKEKIDYGRNLEKLSIEKFKHKQEEKKKAELEKAAAIKETSVVMITNEQDLKKLEQGNLNGANTSSLPKLGNKYLKEVVKASSLEQEDFLKSMKSGIGKGRVQKAFHMSYLLKERSEKAESLVKAYSGATTSRYDPEKIKNANLLVNENLIKSMETKFAALDYYEGVFDSKLPRLKPGQKRIVA